MHNQNETNLREKHIAKETMRDLRIRHNKISVNFGSIRYPFRFETKHLNIHNFTKQYKY